MYQYDPNLSIRACPVNIFLLLEIKESKFRSAHNQLILGSISVNSGGFNTVSGEFQFKINQIKE